MANKQLLIDADFEIDVLIERRNAATRAKEPATGLTSVVGRIAATPGGAAIGACSVSLTEAGTTGRYVGGLDTLVLVAALAAYEGSEVFVVASKLNDFDRIVGRYTVVRQLAM